MIRPTPPRPSDHLMYEHRCPTRSSFALVTFVYLCCKCFHSFSQRAKWKRYIPADAKKNGSNEAFLRLQQQPDLRGRGSLRFTVVRKCCGLQAKQRCLASRRPEIIQARFRFIEEPTRDLVFAFLIFSHAKCPVLPLISKVRAGCCALVWHQVGPGVVCFDEQES